ncbi:hypothetical protein OS190_03020 [Sulfitobacter sp. F26204]|nr:hypothetical protein [Sulfitobacter sp. F26204]
MNDSNKISTQAFVKIRTIGLAVAGIICAAYVLATLFGATFAGLPHWPMITAALSSP